MATDQLEIAERSERNARVVALSGELDVATAPMLSERLQDAIEGFADMHVIIDLSNVAFMDSMGLQVMLSATRRLARERRRLVLVCLPGPILRLLAGTKLDSAFDIAADVPAAVGLLDSEKA
jgi:anti-anti-sigma factor